MARFGLFDRNICQCRKQSSSLRYLSTKRLGAATKIRRLTFSLESMFSELPKFSMCECLARHRKRDQLGCMLGRHTPAQRLAHGGENAVDRLDKAKCGIVACRCPPIYCFGLSDSNVSQCCQQHCSLRHRPTRNLGVATKRRVTFGLTTHHARKQLVIVKHQGTFMSPPCYHVDVKGGATTRHARKQLAIVKHQGTCPHLAYTLILSWSHGRAITHHARNNL